MLLRLLARASSSAAARIARAPAARPAAVISASQPSRWVATRSSCDSGDRAAMGSPESARKSGRRRRLSLVAEEAAASEAAAAAQAAAAEEEEEQQQAPKPTPRKRAKTASKAKGSPAAEPASGDAAAAAAAAAGEDKPKAKAKPKRKPAAAKAPAGPVYEVSMRAPAFEGPAHRFISWNVAGMRALMKKDAAAVRQLVEREQVDAVCIQEHKLQESHVADVVQQVGLEGWHVAFNCSTAKKGYSGTATLCRHKPLSTRLGIGAVEHDDEGRVVTVELPELWLVNVYTPNSGEGLKRLDYRITKWDKALAAYVKDLRTGANAKPVVLLGDLNCAHLEIDVYDPVGFTKKRFAGFTKEERDSFGAELLEGAGLVDAFRAQHPDVIGYTYYGYRGPNGGMRPQGKGWRLDYTLVSGELAPKVHDSYILPDIVGSDHVPLGVIIKK